jgi:hypothetical protein
MLTLYSDPAHAWLEVPVDELSPLGLSIFHDFSRYSYIGRDKRGALCAYLEEDCDLGIFLARYIQKHGKRPYFRDSHAKRSSKVRRMDQMPAGERFKANLEWTGRFYKERYADKAITQAFLEGDHSPSNRWP